MKDFQEHVLLCSTLHTSDWASAMRLVSLRLQHQQQDLSHEGNQLLLNRIRRERIQRYLTLQQQINTAFATGLCELLNEDEDEERLSATMPAPLSGS